MPRAPRPVPLHRRANKTQMIQGLFSSLDETRGSGQLQQERLCNHQRRNPQRLPTEPGCAELLISAG